MKYPFKNAWLAELHSHKCGLDHCFRNLKPVLSSKPWKNAVESDLQAVFFAIHDKSVYCSWRGIGCVAAGNVRKNVIKSRMLRDFVVRGQGTFH